MSEDYKKEPMEELRERITKLEADVTVLCMPLSERDMVVFKDPKQMVTRGVSYVGQQISQIRDEQYLWYLANFLDWQGFESFKKGTKEEVKVSRYRHRDAAKCRYFQRQLFGNKKKRQDGDAVKAPF